jgi:hypothetical protein
MYVLTARNVNDAFYKGLFYLQQFGEPRDSRNGPVLQAPVPVATVYEQPRERVLFDPHRDANPFLHLYESLWMLSGRNDVAPLLRYTKQFAEYSDDGTTFHGAYGHRWRVAFGMDQLHVIARRLFNDFDDRRCVLQVWDANLDLDLTSRDLPCNDTVTFQINHGCLDMVVFCRSNDIVWGAYGANAVHFSMLQEFIAASIGVPVGTYTQISVNYHAYVSVVTPLFERLPTRLYGRPVVYTQPYDNFITSPSMAGDFNSLDVWVRLIVETADNGFTKEPSLPRWARVFHDVLFAHHLWRTLPEPDRFDRPLQLLESWPHPFDWIVAARQWIQRRRDRWEEKQAGRLASME